MGRIENKRVIIHRSRKTEKRINNIRNLVKAFILAVALLIVSFLIYMIFFFGRKTIDLSELTKISFEGYNGKAVAEVLIERPEGIELFIDSVIPKLSKESDLSNGEEVLLAFEYDENLAKKLHIRVKGNEQIFSVENLGEPVFITEDDIFDKISVDFSGFSPIAFASMNIKTDDEISQNIKYEFDGPTSGLSLGEQVKVKATLDRDGLAKLGYAQKEDKQVLTRNIEVSAVDSYVMKPEELNAGFLEQLKENAVRLFSEDGGNALDFGLRVFSSAGIQYSLEGKEYTFKWGNPRYMSAYFSSIKENAVKSDSTQINDVKMVFGNSISQSDGKSVPVEAVVIFRNAKIDKNGQIMMDEKELAGELVSVSAKDSDIKLILNGNEHYNVEKLENF